jgi:hypothetical protein
MLHYLAGVRASRTPDVGFGFSLGRTFSRNAEAFCRRVVEAIFGGKAVRNILIWKSQSKTDNFLSFKSSPIPVSSWQNTLCTVMQIVLLRFSLGSILFTPSNGKVHEIPRSSVLPEWQI